MKTVLVTGGCGFIGSWTTRLLVSKGISVRILDDLSSGQLSRISDLQYVVFRKGSVLCDNDLMEVMDGVDAVIHLAAQVSVTTSIESPLISQQTNIEGFLRVLEACRKLNIPRLVYASSAAVYGVNSKLPLDETSQVSPISPYGLEKLVNEQYAELYGALHGVSALGLRYFNVFGPGQDPSSDYAGVISKFLRAAGTDQKITIFGDGLQTRDFIFVKDIAHTNVEAIFSSETGVLNVATGTSTCLLEIVNALDRVSDKKMRVEHLPPRMGDIRNSSANVNALKERLGVVAQTSIDEGLASLYHSPHLKVT